MIGILILVIFASITIIAIAVYIVILIYKSFVKQHSIWFKEIDELNKKYNFYNVKYFSYTHEYDNEKFYKDISCEDYLIYQLQFDSKNVSPQIFYVHENKKLFNLYMNEVFELNKKLGSYDKTPKGFIIKLLNFIENKMSNKKLLDPVIEFEARVTLKYKKMNGVIYATKYEVFDEEEVLSYISRLKNRNGSFYKDRGIWEAISRVERGRVSNKLRFKVYERDNNRCVKCGRRTDLEIDHIIPIAKGGKTVINNLQTLCHRCNQEKGDRLDWK